MSPIPRFVPGIVRRWLGGLRFPQLFLITTILFAVNLAIPDAIPFIDEILLALGSLLLGSLRKKKEEVAGEIEGTDVARGVGGDEPDDPGAR